MSPLAYTGAHNEGRAMEEPEIIPPSQKFVSNKSWVAAYFEFIRSPHENRVLKLMPMVLLGIIPISLLDNFFIPILGLVDDIPTTIVTIIVLILTWRRVRTYRWENNPRQRVTKSLLTL